MIRYAWKTSRRELLWFPLALLGFFVVILLMMRHPQVRFTITKAYLGFFVPLLAGITAAYAVLDDPALELRFATRARHLQTLLARLVILLAVQGACALAFQLVATALGVDLSPLGTLLDVQLAWIVPTVALAAAGLSVSLASAQCVTGAFVAGAVWLVQLLMKSWLLANGPRVYLFMGILEPGRADLPASRAALLTCSAAALVLSWGLLHRQERYL
jgi:hypothetical protein